MTEEVWFTLIRPHRMLRQVWAEASARQLRLLIVASRRWSDPYMFEQDRAVVSAIECYADGIVTAVEVDRASSTRWLHRYHEDPPHEITLEDMRSALPSHRGNEAERRAQCDLIRDIFGNPFRPVAFDPAWRTEAAVGIARGIYEDRAFERMPILADALQEAGCEHPDILAHCREPGVHVRGCWVVDLLLGKS